MAEPKWPKSCAGKCGYSLPSCSRVLKDDDKGRSRADGVDGASRSKRIEGWRRRGLHLVDYTSIGLTLCVLEPRGRIWVFEIQQERYKSGFCDT